MNNDRMPWWKGERGEWYVVIQIGLFLLVALGPEGASLWPSRMGPRTGAVAGGLLMAAGYILIIAGIRKHGRYIAAVPRPKEGAPLVESGPYRLVRHPMYSGAILASFGWALFVQGALTLLYASLLTAFLVLKARREELWLREKFPGYAAYERRVKGLIPFPW